LGIDFDPEVLFGNAVATPASVTLRGANSRHEQKVTKFCKRVVTKCNQYQIAEQIAALQTLDNLEPHHQEELEDIDRQITRILLQADRMCSPRNPAPWSPALNQAYLRHRLWTIALSAHRNKRDMSKIIESI